MPNKLVTGGQHDPLLPKIVKAIYQADTIELAVAFIKSSGLELLFPALEYATVEREHPAQLTVLTSDYLYVTDPQALKKLMLLAERGANIRVFQTKPQQSFHLKSYVFVQHQDTGAYNGTAFIGSSNISKPALTDGIEWNYQVRVSSDATDQETVGFCEIREEFQKLINRDEVVPLSYQWIDSYEARRPIDRIAIAPGSNDPELPPPEPKPVQQAALEALDMTRSQGYRRGLVVMATGLGKTYLAAFDAKQLGAKRVLFVAHRDEILIQAEATYQRVLPRSTVGYYKGQIKEGHSDMLFASVQTLGRSNHLSNFPSDHFDYIVIDEFHHAAAPTYRKLLSHFEPKFLLGLTATPERTDQSNILSLCDDNLVFSRDLFFGVEEGYLCPFTYFGIYDESVDYHEIPWRNGKFDPESLSNKLATLARARHAYIQWKEKALTKTLAFCVSKKHAQFMADRFQTEGIKAAAVYGGSEMGRKEALEKLNQGLLQVIFSVDLFSEGIDLPAIDTIMMLRPTESKVLFLQQLGRGLRTEDQKERLIILDFIGNHHGFLNKPQALFGIRSSHRDLAAFAQKAKKNNLPLPAGCFANYDLEIISFLLDLVADEPSGEYKSLKASLNRRPTLTEFYRSGARMPRMRSQYGNWWKLVQDEGDFLEAEDRILADHEIFLQDLEKTSMTKSFKAVLIESLLDIDGFCNPPTLDSLSAQALSIFQRRRNLLAHDIPQNLQDVDNIEPSEWNSYWDKNPIRAWAGHNHKNSQHEWFTIENGRFCPTFKIDAVTASVFHTMVQEVVDYRIATYEARIQSHDSMQTEDMRATVSAGVEVPYFHDLNIACGHFKAGLTHVDQYRRVSSKYVSHDMSQTFIVNASGNSMDGGSTPVRDGDHLLLEHIGAKPIETISGATVIFERPSDTEDNQYILRNAKILGNGHIVLKANNPQYSDILANDDIRPVATLRAILDPLEFSIGQTFMREEIPGLFGVSFNPGNWNSGHIVLNEQKVHVLLVTMNKQGKSEEHRYHDHWISSSIFHWQSQRKTTPQSKRGNELIRHDELGISVHLFIREQKLDGGKAAPFKYYGPVKYLKHEGSQPIGIEWGLM
jgi:superfamily II DNA or RNA helicase/HKD family nuclease/SOS-response transcriptional repressor LexA